MRKQIGIPFSALFVFLLFSSGIYRDDVPELLHKKLAAEPHFDCVGQLLKKGELIGSCVLIDSQRVLLAAHCVSSSEPVTDSALSEGKWKKRTRYLPSQKEVPATEYTVAFNGKAYTGRRIHIFPGFLSQSEAVYGDLALLELAEPLKQVIPARLAGAFNEIGSVAVCVGYGASGPAGKTAGIRHRGLKLAGENTIDQASGRLLNGQATELRADMDNPGKPECNRTGSPAALPLEFLPRDGDGGGGLFRMTPNGYELIGVTAGVIFSVSRNPCQKSSYYGEQAVFTRIAAFTEWISATGVY